MHVFQPFQWPRAQHVTCKLLPTNNGLLICNIVLMCFAANNILPSHAFRELLGEKMADPFPELTESDLHMENKLGDQVIKH